MYRDVGIPENAGDPAANGATVSAHYTARLDCGTVFDSSLQRAPLRFTLGEREVIKGFDEGVVGMRVGGQRQLVIEPHLGYGARGAPPDVPPNARLHFDVEVVAIGEVGGGGIWDRMARLVKALPFK